MKERDLGTFKDGVNATRIIPLKPGQRCRVTRAFTDADGDRHNPGEEWLLLAIHFSKFDDEVVLGVSRGGNKEWSIPLIWKKDGQEDIIEHIGTFVEAVP